MGHLQAGRNSLVGEGIMLIPIPNRPIALLRFQKRPHVTPENIIQIRSTNTPIHEQKIQKFVLRLPN